MKKIKFPSLIGVFAILSLIPMSLIHARDEVDAEKIASYFEALRLEQTDFEPVGAVCERVAAREVETLYPAANYTIINGVQYDENKTTRGELDLVVFEKASGKVEAVAEVKCWRSFKGAKKKAKEQRMRFLTHLNKNIIIYDKNQKRYSKELFKQINKYFSISQHGGQNEGFDFELSLDLNELMELRKQLLMCKDQGRCPKR